MSEATETWFRKDCAVPVVIDGKPDEVHAEVFVLVRNGQVATVTTCRPLAFGKPSENVPNVSLFARIGDREFRAEELIQVLSRSTTRPETSTTTGKPKRMPCGGPLVEAARRAIGCECESMIQACNCGKVLCMLLGLQQTHQQIFHQSLGLIERPSEIPPYAIQLERWIAIFGKWVDSPAFAKTPEGVQVSGGDGRVGEVLKVPFVSENEGSAIRGDDLEPSFTSGSGSE